MSVPRRDASNGTWWFVVDLPAGGDGERSPSKRRGFRTKAQAEAALDELRVGVRRGTYVAPGRQTFGQFLVDDWLPAIRSTIQPSTFESYSRNIRLHVVPALGGVPLQQIDAGMLNRFYADLLDHGRKNGQPGGLSARTVRYIHSIVGRALREATAWDRLVRNVAPSAQPPGTAQARSPEMKVWDAPTLTRFLDLVHEDRHQPAWLFLATTGCRRGEALGVRWNDVDLDTGQRRPAPDRLGDRAQAGPRSTDQEPQAPPHRDRPSDDRCGPSGPEAPGPGTASARAGLPGSRPRLRPSRRPAAAPRALLQRLRTSRRPVPATADPPARPPAHVGDPGASGRRRHQDRLRAPRPREHQDHLGHLPARNADDAGRRRRDGRATHFGAD